MLINHEGEIWKHCCSKWSAPKDELWIYKDDGEVEIYCINHDTVLLCLEKDLDE